MEGGLENASKPQTNKKGCSHRKVDVQVPAMRTVPHGWLRAGWPLLWHGGTAEQCASTSQELPHSLLPNPGTKCKKHLCFCCQHRHCSPNVKEGN